MPHIDIKCKPKHLSPEQAEAFFEALTNLVVEHLGAKAENISIDYTEIEPDKWKSEVYDPVIKPRLDKLVKKPGYEF